MMDKATIEHLKVLTESKMQRGETDITMCATEAHDLMETALAAHYWYRMYLRSLEPKPETKAE